MKNQIDDNGLTNHEMYCVAASAILAVTLVLFVGACIGAVAL